MKSVSKFFTDLKKFFPLLLNLSSKDFKLKYRRSVLGMLWSILNPLFTMLVISLVFGRLLKIQVEHFATYYIVGVSLWNFFAESTSGAMGSIISGAPLIKKVYIPKYIFPVEKCLFSLINFAFSLIAVFAVMLIQGVYPTWTAFLGILPVIYCFVFSMGFSLILSALTVYFRDVMHLYSVVLTAWMYITPIIYPSSYIKESGLSFVYGIMLCNPMYHYVEYFRNVIMHGSDPALYALPSFNENLVCIGIALVTLMLGGLIFSKAEKKFILHI